MLDCIIIGSGVAGISAALTLQANGKTFEIFGTKALSEKIVKAEKINNYAGLSSITGKAFQEALQAQLADAKIEIKEEKVAGVYALKDKFTVTTQEGGLYESRCVILACGVEAIKTIAGETEFLGRGVSYCATCDGFLYKGKTIAIVCTSKRLEGEIAHLVGLAKKVYLIPMYKDAEIHADNVEIIQKLPTAIEGTLRVENLRFANPPKVGFSEVLPVDGVFMLRESIAPSALVGGLTVENGHVVVGRDAATNLQGLFAAGDCTGRPYQYAKAAGEGNVAAHSVTAFLSKN